MGLEIVQLSKTYGRGVGALDGVSLEADSGVLAVLGPSGAGKSTLAAIVATLLIPTAGTVRIAYGSAGGMVLAAGPLSVRPAVALASL